MFSLKHLLADSSAEKQPEEGKDDSKKEDKEVENTMEDIAIKNPLLSNIHDFLGKKLILRKALTLQGYLNPEPN